MTGKLGREPSFFLGGKPSTRDRFNHLVSQALEDIPQEFLEKLENVEIVIEEEPSPDLFKEMGLRRDALVLGLYQGTPRPDKSFFQGFNLPDRITLFRRPILHFCRSEQDVIHSIRKTLIHEVAHHFGFSEKKIRQLGY